MINMRKCLNHIRNSLLSWPDTRSLDLKLMPFSINFLNSDTIHTDEVSNTIETKSVIES